MISPHITQSVARQASQPKSPQSHAGALEMTALSERYRLPASFAADFRLTAPLSCGPGYFAFGPDLVCYARNAIGKYSALMDTGLPDLSAYATQDGQTVALPFDPDEAIANLRFERYAIDRRTGAVHDALRRAYYLVRPALPVHVRKHIQRLRISGWTKIKFPKWPIDFTVEDLTECLLIMAINAAGVEQIPFIWFWPDGYSAAAIMTHDVETSAGRDFCGELMNINDGYGIKSSFQLIPERRYQLTHQLIDDIRARGFEPNIHDLNHDGHLFRTRQLFAERAARINAYAREFGAAGFRSAVLYRNIDWLSELQFEYDMSVPNVAHLDPQPKGCCTALPYFIGDLVELPLTTAQDYTVFHLLNEYSTTLWNMQMDLIRQRNGLISLIVHPDYIMEPRGRGVYETLLQRLVELRSDANVWIALPRDVAAWWRQRSKLALVERDGQWQIEGAGCERARVAYASVRNGKLLYSFETHNKSTGAELPVPRDRVA
jgi:hypothetical protein